jgi:glycine hydroxymethyltransferase
MVMCRAAHSKAVDGRVFPGIQGGPLMHVIAAKAVALGEALGDGFKGWARQVVRNAAVLAEVLAERGVALVSGGTDNHLVLVDLRRGDLTGKDAEHALERAGITVNKNTVPGEQRSPFVTSGVRIGTPALTSRGFREEEIRRVAHWIADVLHDPNGDERAARIRAEVKELCGRFPIYPGRLAEARALLSGG